MIACTAGNVIGSIIRVAMALPGEWGRINVAHHPPQLTLDPSQSTLGGRRVLALLGSAFVELILTDYICKD